MRACVTQNRSFTAAAAAAAVLILPVIFPKPVRAADLSSFNIVTPDSSSQATINNSINNSEIKNNITVTANGQSRTYYLNSTSSTSTFQSISISVSSSGSTSSKASAEVKVNAGSSKHQQITPRPSPTAASSAQRLKPPARTAHSTSSVTSLNPAQNIQPCQAKTALWAVLNPWAWIKKYVLHISVAACASP